MRAAVVNHPDATPVCAEIPDPDHRPGQAPLRLVGAGLHHAVRGHASGRHYTSDHNYPLVPGIDAVARREDGRLVYTGFARPPWGTMAELMVTPFEEELPTQADPLAVAAGMNPAMSGWVPLIARHKAMGQLGTTLVLGATGLSGSLAVRSALSLGAKHVIVAGRNREALETLRALGAHTVALTADAPETWVEALGAAIAEAPPELVIDYVCGPVAEAAYAALATSAPQDDSTTTD